MRAMNSRRLDGPGPRREPKPELAKQVILGQPDPAPELVSVPAPDPEPVSAFVYHKPKRRFWHWREGYGQRHPRWWRRAVLVLLAVVLLAGGWFGYKTIAAVHKIIGKSDGGAPALANDFNLTSLKGEGDGRINILILGIGGVGHDGPDLSDTIMVASIDPKTKDVAMLSVPRDLYVKIPGHGQGKINAANAYGGPTLAKQVVEQVIGVPIHYYVVVDFSGFKKAVDAVGGIDVVVDQSLYDPEYPCDDERGGYCPLSIKAGPQHMDGTIALRYARSRKTTSDFDRAARQQKVLAALRQKALQLSTLTNPAKISSLLDVVGDHVKTDLQLDEMRKLAVLVQQVDMSKATQRVLDTGKADSLLLDGTGTIPGAGSIELPKAGTFDYSDIHDYVKNIFVDHYIVDEQARVEVQNGSGVPGLAGQVARSLAAAHYNVADPVNAEVAYSKTVLYDYTNGKKPYTIHYLELRFGVKAVKATLPAVTAAPGAGSTTQSPDVRIILGSDYQPATN